MNENPYILFNKTVDQLRRLGARGGRAYGRNRRTRRALTSVARQAAVTSLPAQAAIASSIKLLDDQFPWLRGAEKPHSQSSSRRFST